MAKISLVGLNKADVLAGLYNASCPRAMGFMAYDSEPMSRVQAEILLKSSTDFNYLYGRAMKVNLEGDELDTYGYDRDNGLGEAERIVAWIRETGDVVSSEILAIHRSKTLEEAERVRRRLAENITVYEEESFYACQLGLSDVADSLGDAIDKAVKSNDHI